MKIIDGHIHLDQYQDEEIDFILTESANIEWLLSVSTDLDSCKRNLQLAKRYRKVKPAFGYHPEQAFPTRESVEKLLDWMCRHINEMAAIGEVGLPYYLKQEQKITLGQYTKYIDLLETFIKLAKDWDKPIVLHAVYDDAPVVCDLLEKYDVKKAHFHWFKGDKKTISRMIGNGYYVSITPDVLYEREIKQLVYSYPLEQMMVETDGPWPFKGPFQDKMTQPIMIMESISMIANIKNLQKEKVAGIILQNTKEFYNIIDF